MNNKQGTLFSIGQFAQKAGVTQRAIRFYDKIGLLKPCSHSQSGHRLYSIQDFARLQKILTLKFIGLSLGDIANIIKYDINDNDFKKSLEIQRDIIDSKIHHMRMVAGAIDETLSMVENYSVLNWDKFIGIINVINIDKNWMEQYQNASNLRARISIHELYSTNKKGWMIWYFDHIEVPEYARVLEVGCGDCSLWVKNIERIPEGWDITLTDFSQGMLKDGRKALEGSGRFKFRVVDVQDIPLDDSSMDVVIANHMLYHVPDMGRAFSEIFRVLKPGGYFYASTVGKNHMWEMKDIVQRFGPEAVNTPDWNHTEKFQLENGMGQLSKYFDDVKVKRYQDSLFVTEAAPLIDYLFSKPGNLRDIFTGERLEKLKEYLNNEINKKGGIYITKDTGFFQGKKSNNHIKERKDD